MVHENKVKTEMVNNPGLGLGQTQKHLFISDWLLILWLVLWSLVPLSTTEDWENLSYS